MRERVFGRTEREERKRFVPYVKLSKRDRRALDNMERVTWGQVNPATRRLKDKKAYDRKREKQAERLFE